MHESRWRSFVKALVWRVLGSILTIIIALIFSQNLTGSIFIGIVDAVLKFIGIFLHERLWSWIKWGYIEEINLADIEVKE